jgi:hypothetical protein
MSAESTDVVRIIRTPHDTERHWFAMSRATAQDKNLSWEARGVLAYLLSKPSDWKVMVADLKQNCGRDKVRKILFELKSLGYLTITQGHDEKGHWTSEYRVYETAQPITEKPSTVNPAPDKPETVKRPLHIKEGHRTDNKESLAPKVASAVIKHNPYKVTDEMVAEVKATRKGKKNRTAIPADVINPVKDELVNLFKWSWLTMTKREQGQIQSASKQLCEVGLTSVDVVGLYRYCQKRFKEFSPMALVNHVSEWRNANASSESSVLTGLRIVS